MHRRVALTAISNFMTKSEFQELQIRAASCGTTLKEFLRDEGVAYSTYNYWSKKTKAESESLPIAPISIHRESCTTPVTATALMDGVDSPGVTLAFSNGVKAHFGRGSEHVLMEVLTKSMY